MRTLRECFLSYDIALLEAIAASRGVLLEEREVPRAAARLAEVLGEEESVRKALARLGPEAQRALRMLLAAGGRMRLSVWERRWGTIRPLGPGRLRREEPWRQPANVSERLWYLGLIGRDFGEEAGHTVEFLFVPEDLKPVLQAWLGEQPSEPPSAPAPCSATPEEVQEAGTLLLEASLAYLGYLYNRPVRVGQGGRLYRTHGEALRAYVVERAPGMAERACFPFLEVLLGETNLTVRREGRLRPEPQRTRVWLESPPEKALDLLRETWLATRRWNDLWHVPSLRCEETGWQNDPRLARQALLAVLRTLAPGAWYAVDDLVQVLFRDNPDFQRPDGDYESWFLRDAETGQYLHGFASWPQVEGALLRHLLTGPLYWLGVVARGDGGRAVRLTASGARWLSGGEGTVEGPQEPPRLEGTTVLIPPSLDRFQRFQLARLADWEPGGPPYRYRLTPASVGRALRQGIPRERVEAFLARLLQGPLPEEFSRALRLWEERAREVRLRRAVVLEVEDPQALEQLLSDPAVSKFLGERLSPRHVLVAPRNVEPLRKALRSRGYQALLEGREPPVS
ncbi:MAG: helicase-associated domain-containing protein [Anaerolineae bacterium]